MSPKQSKRSGAPKVRQIIVQRPDNAKQARQLTGMREARANIKKDSRFKQVSSKPSAGLNLTKMMMLPFDSPVQRLPTADMPNCATLRLRNPDEYTEKYPGSAAAGFAGATYLAVVYGQPGLTYCDGPHPCGVSRYQAEYSAGVTTMNIQILATSPGYGLGFHSVFETCSISALKWASGEVSTGMTYRPMLQSEYDSYFYVNQGETIFLDTLVPDGATTGALSISVQSYTMGAGQHNVHATPWVPFAAVDTALWTATSNGWYRLITAEVDVSGGAVLRDLSYQISVRNTATNYNMWHLNYLPQLEEDDDLGVEVRRTAQTLLVTNTSSDLNAQGDAFGARIRPASPGDFDYAEFSKARDKYTGKAKRGVYTYMEFAREDEVFDGAKDRGSGPRFRLPDTLLNAIYIKNAAYAANPNTYLITSDTVVEFKTSSQMFDCEVASGVYDDLIEARRINNSTSYFYENEWHWKDFARYATVAWNAARRFATPIGTGLSMAFPEASPAIMAAAKLMQT